MRRPELCNGDTMSGSERSQISSFIVMDVMRQAAEREMAGEQVVHMEVGQPATSAPEIARRAAKAALDRDALGYTLALGLPSLRQRISDHYDDTYKVRIDPSRIVITSGSSAGFVLSFLALFDAGQRVALPSPGYPCYRHILSALGQETPLLLTGPDNRWMPTVDDLQALHREKAVSGLVLASPANPTGTMVSPDRLAEIAQFCDVNNIWLISDEIYHGLTYDGEAQTALAVSDRAITINSFSKYYSMTGWRIGWLVVPENVVPVVERLAQNFYISPPTLSQIAAEAAFSARAELEANREVYAANRSLLVAGLTELGLTKFAPPDGAFYLYVDIREFGTDAATFASQMLEETNVAATPGIDFDAEGGHNFVRFCYAGATADMERALERLKTWPRLRTRT